MRYPQLLLAIIFILTTIFAAPVTDTQAYTQYRFLTMDDIRQEQSMWCWAAVTQTIGRYKTGDRAVTQCDIVYDQYAGCWNWGSINSGTIQAALYAEYRLTSVVEWYAVGFTTVQGAIQGESPLAVYWAWRSGNGHHVTIRGYYEDTGTNTRDIFYIDPTPGSAGGFRRNSYAWMVADGNHTWTETLLNVRS